MSSTSAGHPTRFLISVITATFNCETDLRKVKGDLLAQTDQSFEWVVVDGDSTDGTVQVASEFPADRLRLRSEPDFGVYDALNKGVHLATGRYYLVVGADDRLEPHAITEYSRAVLESNADIVTASVQWGDRVLRPLRGGRWLRGGNALVSSHSVGCVIRRSLHDQVGLYSREFVNAADMHFIIRAVDRAAARIHSASFLAGNFGVSGISTVNRICSLSDAYRIQLIAGHNRWIQLALFIARLIRSQLRGQN
jgi:glycosyltransferase involved in cell wall biosynthesis